jgi:hypothetical protein
VSQRIIDKQEINIDFRLFVHVCMCVVKDSTGVQCVQLDKRTGCIISGGSDVHPLQGTSE